MDGSAFDGIAIAYLSSGIVIEIDLKDRASSLGRLSPTRTSRKNSHSGKRNYKKEFRKVASLHTKIME